MFNIVTYLKGRKEYLRAQTRIKEVPYEYFCNSCGQLRLSSDFILTGCDNCGSLDIIKGKPLSLDKDALEKQFREKGEEDEKSNTTK